MRGSLLIEILIGLAVFAGGVLLALSVFPTSGRALEQSENRTLAINLARRVLESQRALTYDGIALGQQADQTVKLTGVSNGATTNQDFIYTVDVTEPAPGRKLKSVRVEVRWSHGSSHRKVELQTYMAPL